MYQKLRVYMHIKKKVVRRTVHQILYNRRSLILQPLNTPINKALETGSSVFPGGIYGKTEIAPKFVILQTIDLI